MWKDINLIWGSSLYVPFFKCVACTAKPGSLPHTPIVNTDLDREMWLGCHTEIHSTDKGSQGMKLKLQASPETETWDLCAITGYLFFYFITPLMCCLIETVVNNLHFFDISLTLKRFECAENPKKKTLNIRSINIFLKYFQYRIVTKQQVWALHFDLKIFEYEKEVGGG